MVVFKSLFLPLISVSYQLWPSKGLHLCVHLFCGLSNPSACLSVCLVVSMSVCVCVCVCVKLWYVLVVIGKAENSDGCIILLCITQCHVLQFSHTLACYFSLFNSPLIWMCDIHSYRVTWPGCNTACCVHPSGSHTATCTTLMHGQCLCNYVPCIKFGTPISAWSLLYNTYLHILKEV